MLEYERERSSSSVTKLNAHRLVGKNKLYLKMLTSGFSKLSGTAEYLFRDVLALLEG
jgi:hypothetical protein